MLTYAIIGTPAGFKCVTWKIGKEGAGNIDLKLDIDIFKILPSKTGELFLFKLQQEPSGSWLRYFILYIGADEIKDKRDGSFYGAAVILRDVEVSVRDAISALRELANFVKHVCIDQTNGKFKCSLEDAARFIDEVHNGEVPKGIASLYKRIESKAPESKGNKIDLLEDSVFYKVDEISTNIEDAAEKLYKYRYCDMYISHDQIIENIVRKKNKLRIKYYPPKSASAHKSTLYKAGFYGGHSEANFQTKNGIGTDDSSSNRLRNETLYPVRESNRFQQGFRHMPGELGGGSRFDNKQTYKIRAIWYLTLANLAILLLIFITLLITALKAPDNQTTIQSDMTAKLSQDQMNIILSAISSVKSQDNNLLYQQNKRAYKYKIKIGDTLEQIAKRCYTKPIKEAIDEVIYLNPEIRNNSSLIPGQEINLYIKCP